MSVCFVFLQRVGFLPGRDSQEEVVWVNLEESQSMPEIDWQIMTFTPPPEQENRQYSKNLYRYIYFLICFFFPQKSQVKDFKFENHPLHASIQFFFVFYPLH